MKKIFMLAMLVLGFSVQPTRAVIINWVAVTTNGLGDSSGQALEVGDLLRLGTFDVSNSVIQANVSNYAFLNSHFTQFDSTTIGDSGDALNIAGYWSRTSPNLSTDGIGVDGSQIYIWAFNAVDGMSATEQGIFTSSSVNWFFPSDDSVPNTTSIELNQVTTIVVGGFGVGTSSATGSPQPFYNLTAVPEPSTYALLGGLGVLGLAVWRRRICQRG